MALYRVAITGTVSTEPFANVIYVDSGSAQAQAVCDAADTYFVDLIRGICGSNVTYGSITATEVNHSLLDPDYFQKSISKAGSYLGLTNKSDPQLALLMRLHTGLSGRARRGRIFLAGTPDEWVENGKFVGTYHTTLAGQLQTAWTGSSPSSGMNLVVFSRKYFSLLSNPFADSYKPVTSITAGNVMSTMRSRKPQA